MNKDKIRDAVKVLLESIGEDIGRQGLVSTPDRIANMYEEIFSGIGDDPKRYLNTFIDDNVSDEIIVVKDIPIYSMCEHHMLPFCGRCSIGYIPNNKTVLGLSKFARIANCFARRLQIQERLTNEICEFIFCNLNAKGTAVVIEAEHMCMTMRGIESHGAMTKTFVSKGIFQTNFEKRMEVMDLLR